MKERPLLKDLPKAPYDLDAGERIAALIEAQEFVHNIGPWPIPKGHGTYIEKRPGLGITVGSYEVDCRYLPHRWSICYSVSAWRTNGEKRFGDSL